MNLLFSSFPLFQQWEPSKLELVSDEMVDHYFAKVEAPDIEHLRLPARKNIPKALESKL